MSPEQRAKLIVAALEARQRAYAPYSKFLVGAAVQTIGGAIFVGCNVENASYGLTICAERVAIGTAVAAGQTRFAGMAIATSGGHAPCGACRQVMSEFCADLPIWLVDTDRTSDGDAAIAEARLAELLPGRFIFPT